LQYCLFQRQDRSATLKFCQNRCNSNDPSQVRTSEVPGVRPLRRVKRKSGAQKERFLWINKISSMIAGSKSHNLIPLRIMNDSRSSLSWNFMVHDNINRYAWLIIIQDMDWHTNTNTKSCSYFNCGVHVVTESNIIHHIYIIYHIS
jgi:hypothetical protein